MLTLAEEVRNLRKSQEVLVKKLDEKDAVIGNLAIVLKRIEKGATPKAAGEMRLSQEELSILAAEALVKLEHTDFWHKNKSIRDALGENTD